MRAARHLLACSAAGALALSAPAPAQEAGSATSEFQEGPAAGQPAAPSPSQSSRIQFLENQLRATQRALALMQAELDALKKGQPSPLPQATPETTGALAATPPGPDVQPSTRPTAPPTPRPPTQRRTTPDADELSLAEQDAPSPEQERPDFTPGFLREARAVLIRPGFLEVDPNVRYQHNSTNLLNVQGLDIIEAIFIGRFEIGKVKRDQVRPALSFRYGVSDRIQLNLDVPYLHTWAQEFLPPEVQRIPTRGRTTKTDNGDIGDVTGGFSYHLWRESDLLPDVILTGSVKTDTGNGPFDVSINEASTGTGFWGVTGGLTFVKVSDPGALFANVGYFYHIEDTVNGVKFDPADSVSWGLGYSWALNPYLSLTTNVNGRYVFETRANGIKIAGSNQTIANMSLGLTYGYGINRAFDISFGLGLTDESPDFSLSLSMPFTYNVGNLLDYVF